MKFDAWSLVLQAANFAVLLWLLQHFLYQPLSALLAKRRDEAAAEAARLAQARTALEQDRAQLAGDASRLAAEREAAAVTVKATAEEACRSLRAQADERIRLAEQVSRAALVQEQAQARRELMIEAGSLAAVFVEKLVTRPGVGVPLQPFVLGACAALAGARDRLPRSRIELEAIASRPLDEAERAELLVRLDSLKLPDLRTTFRVDPSLLAGVEFRVAGLVIRNHWADDLAALRRAVETADA